MNKKARINVVQSCLSMRGLLLKGRKKKIIKMKFIIMHTQNSTQYTLLPSTVPSGNTQKKGKVFYAFNVEIYAAIFMITLLDKLLSIKVHHALKINAFC